MPRAATAALFASLTGLVFHCDLDPATLRRVVLDCAIKTGGLLLAPLAGVLVITYWPSLFSGG